MAHVSIGVGEMIRDDSASSESSSSTATWTPTRASDAVAFLRPQPNTEGSLSISVVAVVVCTLLCAAAPLGATCAAWSECGHLPNACARLVDDEWRFCAFVVGAAAQRPSASADTATSQTPYWPTNETHGGRCPPHSMHADALARTVSRVMGVNCEQ